MYVHVHVYVYVYVYVYEHVHVYVCECVSLCMCMRTVHVHVHECQNLTCCSLPAVPQRSRPVALSRSRVTRHGLHGSPSGQGLDAAAISSSFLAQSEAVTVTLTVTEA
jgi:hypothetical protein